MNEVPGDEWRTELVRMTAAVRPTEGATDRIREGLRRSRRRRALGAVAGGMAAVTVLAVGGSVVAGVGWGPVGTLPGSVTRTPSASLFECETKSKALGPGPVIADLSEQERAVERLLALSSVQVRHAAPSPLGVVAFVDDASGDMDAYADPAVVARLKNAGAAHVYEWDPSMAPEGTEAEEMEGLVAGWLLEPAVRDVRRATRGLVGAAGIALWKDAGAVLVQWKAPVPTEVQALAGVRPDGVTVVVEPVTYARRDIARAQQQLEGVLRERNLEDRWSSSSACADGSGLVVGMVPPVDDRAQLQEDFAEELGLPVMIVPEERPVLH